MEVAYSTRHEYEESYGLVSIFTILWLSIATATREDPQANANVPTLLTFSGIVIDLSAEHPSNASEPTVSTLLGIVIDVNNVFLQNAYASIALTLFGMSSTSCCILCQINVVLDLLYKLPFKLEKVAFPSSTIIDSKLFWAKFGGIVVTPLGNVTVHEAQPSNAPVPKLVTVLGISSITAFPAPLNNVVCSLLYKLPPRLEYSVFASSTVIINELQLEKTQLEMSVTLLGIMIDVSEAQPEKA